MVGALDHAAAWVQELVFYPFQGNAQMRALVAVHKGFVLKLYHYKALLTHAEPAAAAVRHLIEPAQWNE